MFPTIVNKLYGRYLNQIKGVRYLRTRKEIKLAPPHIEKRLDCVIFGLPNVGKSVLLNSLIKFKLAATSRKRHTTRGEILGVFNHRNTQLVFYDTPGYISDVGDLRKEAKILRESATDSIGRAKADVVLLVVDAAKPLTDNFKYLFGEVVNIGLKSVKKEVILILNKVDLVEPKSKLLDLTRELVSLINGVKLGEEKQHLAELDTTTFMISALKSDGTLDLKNYLIRIADKKRWLLSKEEGYSNLSMEQRIEELLLEKLLEHTHEEIPYIAKIECLNIELQQQDNEESVKVELNILVENTRQVKIVVGHQGRTMLAMRQSLSHEIEKLFQKKVYVYLYIKKSKQTVNQRNSVNNEMDDEM
jgi:GTP-binding protein Era